MDLQKPSQGTLWISLRNGAAAWLETTHVFFWQNLRRFFVLVPLLHKGDAKPFVFFKSVGDAKRVDGSFSEGMYLEQLGS